MWRVFGRGRRGPRRHGTASARGRSTRPGDQTRGADPGIEYLSLLRCATRPGLAPPAIAHAEWNGAEGGCAARLADLYEQAVTAPDTAALAEPAFADARRHLTYLAGAAGHEPKCRDAVSPRPSLRGSA